MTNHKFIVIGQGSIGQRHSRLLGALGRVACVSAQAIGAFRSITEAVRSEQFSHAVIANVTSQHVPAAEELARAGFQGHVLVEKPVCDTIAAVDAFSTAVDNFQSVSIGYNLRFHPVVRALSRMMAGQRIVEARLAVGQLLSDWRPGTDYTESSSASVVAGGGVLRDLSHELDLAIFLFGPWKRVVSMGGNFGRLGIATDEAWSIILEMQSGAMVSVQLNYFDRPGHRSISVTTDQNSIVADIAAGFVSADGDSQAFVVHRDDTYKALHADFVEGRSYVCSLAEAAAVMRLIDAIERSSKERKWIEA